MDTRFVPTRRMLPLLGLLLAVSCQPKEPAQTSSTALNSCLEGEALEAAQLPAGKLDDVSSITTSGRRIEPAGQVIPLEAYSHSVLFSPDCSKIYVQRTGRFFVDVYDGVTGTLLTSLENAGGFRGMTVDPSSGILFTADSNRRAVSRFQWTAENTLELTHRQELVGLPIEVVLSADGTRLFAISSSNSAMWELNSEDLSVLSETTTRGVFPYAAALTPDETRLLVTHVGDDTLAVLNVASGEVEKEIPVGLNPMGLVVDPERNRAWVANSDSDTISVVALDTFEVVKTVDLTWSEDKLPGGGLNELAIAPDHSFVVATHAYLNKADVLDAATFERIGSFATGHFATGAAVCQNEGSTQIAVVGMKGWGENNLSLHEKPALLSLVAWPPTPDEMTQMTKNADDYFHRPDKYWDSTCPDKVPLPLDVSKERVIEHVVLIVRENKTYDAIMGDFERGNGDPALTLFGEDYTPNLHELARQFVNMDNYYADAERSAQGHTWTTQAITNVFFEKVYPNDLNQAVVISWDPSTIMAESNFFDHLWGNGLTFRNYGEIEGFGPKMMDLYRDFVDLKYPLFNMGIPDVWKANEFIRELNLGIFDDFVYIGLPNDHTAGTDPGYPTPASMVADNDEATGMIVDAIAKSPYWDNTVIFIIEDDPQGHGGDHVHAHRSICVVVSPWVKREVTSSVHYSIPALYRTIEMLLRIPPMHKHDALAPPMYDIFLSGEGDETPDLTPYDCIPRLFPEEFNTADSPMAAESQKFDWTEVDNAPGLGYIIWKSQKGDEEPPPYAKWTDE